MWGFLERRRQKKLETLWQAARGGLAAGRPQEALVALDSILTDDPGNGDGFLLRVRALRELGRAEEADQILRNLGQWSDPAVRDRAALERACAHLEEKQWKLCRGLLPVAPPAEDRWRWLEASLRCAYELVQTPAFRDLRDRHWREPDPAELEDARTRRAVSAIHGLLASFLEDELDSGKPASRAPIERHYARALELWPENEEARRGLESLLAGPEASEAEPQPPEPAEALAEEAGAEALAASRPTREELAALRRLRAAGEARAPTPPELDLYEALLLLQEQRPTDAAPLLNLAREQEGLRAAVFPRLVLAHLLARDRDGIDESFSPWEKWLGAGLQAASAEELRGWEGPLGDYIELAGATGRLQSWRLQNWVRDLLERGCGGTRCFQMLFEADAGLRVMQEPAPGRGLELLQHFAFALPPELARGV